VFLNNLSTSILWLSPRYRILLENQDFKQEILTIVLLLSAMALKFFDSCWSLNSIGKKKDGTEILEFLVQRFCLISFPRVKTRIHYFLFDSVFIKKKIIKSNFFLKKLKLVQTGRFWFCFLGQKPVQTGLTRFFAGLARVFFGLGSVRFFQF